MEFVAEIEMDDKSIKKHIVNGIDHIEAMAQADQIARRYKSWEFTTIYPNTGSSQMRQPSKFMSIDQLLIIKNNGYKTKDEEWNKVEVDRLIQLKK